MEQISNLTWRLKVVSKGIERILHVRKTGIRVLPPKPQPQPTQSSLSPGKKQEIKEALMKEAQQLLERSKIGLSSLKESIRIHFQTTGDEADRSNKNPFLDVSETTLTSRKNRLVEIISALDRIDQPDFGFCGECGKEIPAERILAGFPNICINCQKEEEAEEKKSWKNKFRR